MHIIMIQFSYQCITVHPTLHRLPTKQCFNNTSGSTFSPSVNTAMQLQHFPCTTFQSKPIIIINCSSYSFELIKTNIYHLDNTPSQVFSPYALPITDPFFAYKLSSHMQKIRETHIFWIPKAETPLAMWCIVRYFFSTTIVTQSQCYRGSPAYSFLLYATFVRTTYNILSFIHTFPFVEGFSLQKNPLFCIVGSLL